MKVKSGARNRIILTLLVPALFAACGSSGRPPNPPGPIPSLAILNQSQFDLTELRIHANADFLKEKSVYPGVMKQNEMLVFYGVGEYYVTVLRVKYEGGPI